MGVAYVLRIRSYSNHSNPGYFSMEYYLYGWKCLVFALPQMDSKINATIILFATNHLEIIVKYERWGKSVGAICP